MVIALLLRLMNCLSSRLETLALFERKSLIKGHLECIQRLISNAEFIFVLNDKTIPTKD